MALDCHAIVGLSYTEGTERVRALVRHADTALYAAKEQGQGQWTEFKPGRDDTAASPTCGEV